MRKCALCNAFIDENERNINICGQCIEMADCCGLAEIT